MKKRMFLAVFILPVLGLLALVLSLSVRAGPTFTGDAPADFTAPDVQYVPDPGGRDVGLPNTAPGYVVSGWDMVGAYFDYDHDTDIMYIGIDCYGICGDADGDGDPGGSSTWLTDLGGVDLADLGTSESFLILIDPDLDYIPLSGEAGYEVIVGVDVFNDITTFGAYNFTGSPVYPSYGFGAPLPNATTLYANPSAAAPDIEFSIADFSTLPDAAGFVIPGESFSFQVMLFGGSFQDAGIGEDYIPSYLDAVTVTIPGLSALGNYVWEDSNEDGIQDSGEPGIPNVTVDLYNCDDTFISTTLTNGSGYYTFTNLTPGNYYVSFTLPFGYVFTVQDAGSNDAVDSDADPLTGQAICTTLELGERDPTWDAGMFQPPPAIEIVKEVSAGWVAPNAIVVYTLTVTNTGGVPLNPVELTDTLDPGLTFISGSAIPPETSVTGTSVTGQVIYWADITGGAGLDPFESTQVVFEAIASAVPGLYDNFALVTGHPPTGGTVTDNASVSLLVENPSISLNKTLVPPGVVGDLVTFTISIENTGPSVIDVLPLYDSFTGPAIYVGGTPLANDIDNINQELFWNDLTTYFGDMLPGQIFDVYTVFQLTNPVSYTLINIAEIPLGGVDSYTNPVTHPPVSTAVEVINFQAVPRDRGVLLSWETAAEVDTYGFRILRDDVGELIFVPSQAQSDASGAGYEYLDATVTAGQTYTYWLIDVNMTQDDKTVNGPAIVTVSSSATIYLPIVLR